MSDPQPYFREAPSVDDLSDYQRGFFSSLVSILERLHPAKLDRNQSVAELSDGTLSIELQHADDPDTWIVVLVDDEIYFSPPTPPPPEQADMGLGSDTANGLELVEAALSGRLALDVKRKGCEIVLLRMLIRATDGSYRDAGGWKRSWPPTLTKAETLRYTPPAFT